MSNDLQGQVQKAIDKLVVTEAIKQLNPSR
jgi:hypothetical protein